MQAKYDKAASALSNLANQILFTRCANIIGNPQGEPEQQNAAIARRPLRCLPCSRVAIFEFR